MITQSKQMRPFIGAKDFNESRAFYQSIGFEEIIIDKKMSLFKINDHLGFYLQDAYVRDWIDNTMIFVEVADVESYWRELSALNLTATYKNARLVPIRVHDWGRECFLHDPSGVLWHFGEFFK